MEHWTMASQICNFSISTYISFSDPFVIYLVNIPSYASRLLVILLLKFFISTSQTSCHFFHRAISQTLSCFRPFPGLGWGWARIPQEGLELKVEKRNCISFKKRLTEHLVLSRAMIARLSQNLATCAGGQALVNNLLALMHSNPPAGNQSPASWAPLQASAHQVSLI